MIKQLKVISSVKHTGKTFDFTKGLNTITGANEAGKSHILELIAFAMFGSGALRLKASDYTIKMVVELTLEISGKEYVIHRNLTNAKIEQAGEIIAKSTTVVNQQVAKLLGYGYDVFQVANMASQDEIRYLSSLKPTDRKKMIDKTLGLSTTKQVIDNHKIKLREFTSNLRMLDSLKPVECQEVDITLLDYYNEQVNKQNILIDHLKSEKTTLTLKHEQYKKLVKGISEIKIPEINTNIVIPEGVTQESLNNLETTKQKLTLENNSKLDVIHRLKGEIAENLSQRMLAKEKIDILESKIGDYTLEKLEADLNHLNLAQTKKKLLAQGSLPCEACGHNTPLAHDQLVNIPDWVDADFKKPNFITVEDFKNKDSFVARLEHLQTLEVMLNRKLETANSNFEISDTNLFSFTQDNDHILSNIKVYREILDKTPLVVKAINTLELLNSQLKELEKPNDSDLEVIQFSINEAISQISSFNKAISDIVKYKEYLNSVEQHSNKYLELTNAIECEKLILETLEILLNSIRNEMLPKINSVATNWIKKLSSSSHSSVILTDDMDILMDGLTLDAYSGSGKAIAHIALRLALAQVLTRGVFPIFMGDEVDASMDADRSPAALEAFKEMLNISTSQIILISHQDLNLKLDSDNAIQL